MFIIAGLILFLVLVGNLQFTPWPEMLLWPYLTLHGWLPYKDIAIAHSPLLIVFLTAFFKMFTIGILQLKIFSWFVILLNSSVLFVISRRLYPKINSGLVFFLYLLLVFRYEGNGIWFDQAMVVPILLMFYFINTKKYFYAGLCWGIALAIKQTAFWFLFPILIYLPNIFKFVKGLLVVFIAWWGLTIMLGIFPDYWNWSVKFGLGVLPGMPGLPSLTQFISGMLVYSFVLFIPFVKNKSIIFKLFLWSLFGALGTYPRWGLFHFQPALPFIAISITYLWHNISHNIKYYYLIYLVILLLVSVRYYSRVWRQPDRFMEPEFQRAIVVAKNTPGTIFNLNWWDSIYVYAEKFPPKPWIPQLPWYPPLVIHTLPDLLIYYPGGNTQLEKYIFSVFPSPSVSCTLGCTIQRADRPAN